MDPRIDLLLRIVDQAYNKKAWHGTTLRGSIRGLSAKEALWRPASRRHNIWEIVLHTAYWKYAVRRRLRNDEKGSFPRQGSDWPQLPAATNDKAWKRDVALLRAEHLGLLEAIEALRPRELESRARGSTWTHAQTIYGIASHDLYHAGQIQLLKRLRRG